MLECVSDQAGNMGASGKGVSVPPVNVNQLLELILDVFAGDKTWEQAAKEAAMPYKTWAAVFAKNQAVDMLNEALEKAELGKLTKSDFSEKLVLESVRIGKLIRSYMKHEISENELVEELGSKSLRKLMQDYLSAMEIPKKLGVNNVSEIFLLPAHTLAYRASMAAYQVYREAQEDLTRMHARRVEIEKACEESIRRIRAYREEMDRVVSQYLTVRLEVFEAGFAAMDQAVLAGDTNGYIRGNAEIQKMLGYDSQFTGQEEFDDLMISDEAFKL